MKTLKISLFLTFIAPLLYAQTSMDITGRAMKLYNDSLYAQAYGAFEKISSEGGLSEDLMSVSKYYMANCLLRLGQTDGAISSFEDFVKSYPFSKFRDQAIFKLGSLYFAKADYFHSREKFNILIDLYPNSDYTGTAYYLIGQSFIEQKKFLEAEDYFLQAIGSEANNKYQDYSIYSLAYVYEKEKSYRKAVKYYTQIIDYYDESKLLPEAQRRLGICYYSLKEYDSALLELQDSKLAGLPESEALEAKLIIANSYFRLKDYKNAQNAYQGIIEKYQSPKTENEARYSLGLINFQTANYDGAYKIFSSLANNAEDSTRQKALYWGAESKRYSGKKEEAMNLYRQFVASYPESSLLAKVRFSMASLYYGQGQDSKSEELLLTEENLADKADDAKSSILLGEIHLKNKKFNDAKAAFEKALKMGTVEKSLRQRASLGLGASLFYLENYDEAIKALTVLDDENFEKDRVNFYLAECFSQKGDYGQALKHYQKVSPQNKEIQEQSLYGKAYAYFNQGDFANSSYYFNEFVQKYPNSQDFNDARLRLADSYYAIEKFDKAGEIYSEIFLNGKPDLKDDLAYYQYGQALFRSGKSQDAIKILRDLQVKFPSSKYSESAQYLVGWIYFKSNSFQNAIDEYHKALEMFPSTTLKPTLYYSIGDTYFNMEKYDSAVANYSHVVDSYPDSKYVLDAINGIQYSYIAQDRPAEASAYIEKYLAGNPNSSIADQIYYKKGEIFYNLGNYSGAKLAFQDFISKYPSSQLDAQAYYWLGKSCSNLSDLEAAEESFRKLLSDYASSEVTIDAAVELGGMKEKAKDYKGAAGIYDAIIKKSPNSERTPELMFLLAQDQLLDKNQAQAYSVFSDIIKYYDGSIFADKAKVEVGKLELSRKSYESAESILTEVCQTKTDDIGAQAQYYLGVTYFDQNRYDDAISAFVRVKNVFQDFPPWYVKSLLKLGDSYLAVKDRARAKEIYLLVENINSKDEFGKEARAKLKKL